MKSTVRKNLAVSLDPNRLHHQIKGVRMSEEWEVFRLSRLLCQI